MKKRLHHCTFGVVLIVLMQYGVSIAHAEFVFGEPVKLAPPINLPGSYDAHPALSPGELEIYFNSTRNGRGIYTSQRDSKSDPFDPPTKMMSDTFNPSLSSDGLTLYFATNTSGFGQMDIFAMMRPTLDGNWSDPVNLGDNINTHQVDRFPGISHDGLELYFSRTPSESDMDDIWVARRPSPSDAFGSAEKLPPTLNTTGELDSAPHLSPDGLTLFFSSSRPDGYGGFDIWYSTRQDRESPWEEVTNLGPVINTADDEGMSLMASDGSAFYFSRSMDASDINANSDIWQSAIIPEPSTIWLCMIGLGIVIGWRKWRS